MKLLFLVLAGGVLRFSIGYESVVPSVVLFIPLLILSFLLSPCLFLRFSFLSLSLPPSPFSTSPPSSSSSSLLPLLASAPSPGMCYFSLACRARLTAQNAGRSAHRKLSGTWCGSTKPAVLSASFYQLYVTKLEALGLYPIKQDTEERRGLSERRSYVAGKGTREKMSGRVSIYVCICV